MSTKDEEAKDNPNIVMVDEATGEKYARAVGKKGIGSNGEMEWLVRDMVDVLKSWVCTCACTCTCKCTCPCRV